MHSGLTVDKPSPISVLDVFLPFGDCVSSPDDLKTLPLSHFIEERRRCVRQHLNYPHAVTLIGSPR